MDGGSDLRFSVAHNYGSRLAIVGSASFGRQIAGHAKISGQFEVVGFFDDFAPLGEDIIGRAADIVAMHEAGKFDCLAIGVGYRQMIFRDQICQQVKNKVPLASIRHGSAWVDPDAVVGEGCILLNGSAVDQRTILGRNCFMSLSATVSHDSRVGDSTYMSPKATVCGNCNIGNRVFLGAGCVIRDGVTICDDAIIGAGAIVVKNITEPGIYMGNPARQKVI